VRAAGPPIAPEEMWNPDAVLRVEDIHHRPNTQERLDKAAATQMVFEDGLVHIIDGLIHMTGSDRLVLTGGAALNAAANMRVLGHFDAGYYGRVLKRSTRLHLWTPPVPNDAGATVGAAYAFAAAAGVGLGPSLQHAFCCGRAPRMSDILVVLEDAADVAWNVGGPIAQTPTQAIDTLRRAKGMDGVFIFSGEGQLSRPGPGNLEPAPRRGSLNGSWSGKAKQTPRSSYPDRGRVEQRIVGTCENHWSGVNRLANLALTHFWCSDRCAAGGTVADSTSWGNHRRCAVRLIPRR
jgi:Carbamoyltransferase N-terminus